MNWETKFGQWVKNRGVVNLCRDLDVTRNAVYNWIAGRSEPTTANCLRIMELSEGELTLRDICSHVQTASRNGDPALT